MVATRQLSSVVVLVAASFSGVDTAPIASPPSAGRRIPAHAGAESGHASEVAYEVGVVYTYDYSMDLESVRASCGAGGGVTNDGAVLVQARSSRATRRPRCR